MRNQTHISDLGWVALRFLSLLLVVGPLTGLMGCTRSFYRECADREVNDIMAEKDKYERWRLEQFHVYPDPRARFADPTNPDHPPMPPDDEAAWTLSPHPQRPGHAGVGDVWGTGYLEMIKVWDAQSRAEREAVKAKENQDAGASDRPRHPIQTLFDDPLKNTELQGFLLTLDQSVELGVINSPTYQTFREQLYQAALPVTQQRFSFSYQWAAIADIVRLWAGPKTATGEQNTWSANTSASFSKLFSTGALLTFDFANNTAINFASSQGLTSSSTVNLSLVQPLLQGGGQAVTLEPLTQAERNLLYSIRAFGRFRQQFYVAVALGTNLPNNLSSAAGAGGGSNPISVLAALGIASTDVSGGFVSYLSTLYRECDLALDRKLVHDLEKALLLYEGYQEIGLFSPLQVDQVRSTLLTARNTVLTDQQFVTNALDQFKLALGMPANMPLILDDTLARPVTRQLDAYYEIIDDMDAAKKRLEKIENQPQAAADKLRGFLQDTYLKSALVHNTNFQKKFPKSWEAWRANAKNKTLQDRLEQLMKERRTVFDLRTDLLGKGANLSPRDESRLLDIEYEIDIGKMEQLLLLYETRPWAKAAKEDQARREQALYYRKVMSAALDVLTWARNERFDRTTKGWPELPTTALDDYDLLSLNVDKAEELAVKSALADRFDLMNARAQVVDSWRQLRVTANALMGVFNVGYNLRSSTPPDGSHPLAFTSSATSQQINFNFQLPLNRLAERNAYRAALINYQQARRSLMSLQDNIAVQVRFDVRQLQLFANNYRIQKQTLKSLYNQVESALELIVSPADPDQLKVSSTTGQGTAAALTSQYLTALNQLNNAQVRMYLIWLSFQGTRMQLYLDLQRLSVNERGIWLDPIKSQDCDEQPGQRMTSGSSPASQAPHSGDADGPTFLPLRFGAPIGTDR